MITVSRIVRSVGMLALIGSVGCDLLEVHDPTAVKAEDLGNPEGAELLRAEPIFRFYQSMMRGANAAAFVADEFFMHPSRSVASGTGTPNVDYRLTVRDTRNEEAVTVILTPYSEYNSTRIASSHAIHWFLRFGTEAQRAYIGQLLGIKGLVATAMAEQICEGFPLHDIDIQTGQIIFRPPLTTDEVFELAAATLDSAITFAGDSSRFEYLARVARGRALVGLGRFEEAREVVEPVPTTFRYDAELGPSPRVAHPFNWNLSATGNNRSVADGKGGNGLDYVSSNDPRIQLTYLGTAWDGITEIYAITRYKASAENYMILASGIEARLIEAEAALNAGDSKWLTILNDLRANNEVLAMYGVQPGQLPPLSDPGNEDARIDLVFRERAFWLFATGHRLGDMRRLIRIYGRDVDEVFPTGEDPVGYPYQPWISIPFRPANEGVAGTGVTGCKD